MSDPTRQDVTDAHIQGLYDHVYKLEKAVTTMAWWLVQAQTGFGKQDARGIEDIIRDPKPAQAVPDA